MALSAARNCRSFLATADRVSISAHLSLSLPQTPFRCPSLGNGTTHLFAALHSCFSVHLDGGRRSGLIQTGTTGWAQVNYPYGESDEDAVEKLKYDLYYIRHYSLKLDAMIVLKTLYTMLFGKGR